MSRPMRTRRLLNKVIESNSSCEKKTNRVAKGETRKSTRSRGKPRGSTIAKNQETEAKKSSVLKDKTNSIEISKSIDKEKPKGVNEEQRSSITKKERESPIINRENRLRRRNESLEKISKAETSQPDKKTIQNKFFKSKKQGEIKNQVEKGTKQLKRRQKESLGYAVPLRQTTLSESFCKGSLRGRLRPRKNAKDYKDESSLSVLLDKSISPDKRKSFILLERIDTSKGAVRPPIYKTVKLADDGEQNNKDKDSVYDFQFDLNDPSEKPVRNKTARKKNTRKPIAVRKKKKKTFVSVKKMDSDKKEKEKTIQENEIHPENEEKRPIVDNKLETMKKIEVPEVTEQQKASIVDENPEKLPRARICNVETLTGARKVSFKPNLSISRQSSAKFNPFRSTQSIFRPRNTTNARDMMDHSLLNKSLSPIKAAEIEPFDPASPWRPPVPNSFSSIRRIVQSTPQAKRNFDVKPQSVRIEENYEKDENEAGKLSSLPKKPLGVKISNEENILGSNSMKNHPLLAQQEIAKLAIAKKPLGENRQSSGFGDRLYKSPKKGDKIMTNNLGSPGIKKKKNQIIETQENDSVSDNNEENSPPVEESRLLKQSNLNTFLNIDEMPESIRINTSHGIFGDENCDVSITRNQPKDKISQANIENCFGFDDDCPSEEQIVSPVKFERKQATPVKRMFQRLKGRVLAKDKKQGAARISLGEIKNTLYPRKDKKIIDNKSEERKNKDVDLEGVADLRKKKNDIKTKEIVDPVQFSDTFDVMSENNDDGKSLGNEIALFADLEPVHFTQPPRWSYAKKRDRKQYWSSDEDGENDSDDRDNTPILKKRKLAKLNKVEEKKINEWVKSVNETFQEIDDFDLVVEKLP